MVETVERGGHLEFALKDERGGLADVGCGRKRGVRDDVLLLVCVSGSMMVIYWD